MKNLSPARLFINSIIFWALFLYIAGSLPATEKKAAKIPGWILVWEDEFDGTRIDLNKWRVENAALDKNNELQYYCPSEVKVRKGLLTLRSRKKRKGGRRYTSGLVESKGKFTQIYGRFEIRAKLPRGKGIWPAHWLMNASGVWPPEIDIMEMLGHEPHTIHMTNHFGSWPNNRLEGHSYTGPDFTQDFHTFALEWEKDELRWYIDGVKRHSTRDNIPRKPFYLVLNTAVGGNWPGNPDETTIFPQYHQIDYVRVYKRDIAGTRTLTISARNGQVNCNPDSSRYDLNSYVELTAVPDIGYKFSSWRGDLVGGQNPVEIYMNKNKKVTASFLKDYQAPQLLSLAREVTVSSVERPGLEAAKAVDGDLNTRWSSRLAAPQWLYVDLGKVSDIKVIRIKWPPGYGDDYQVQISADARNWKTIAEVAADGPETKEVRLTGTKARYVRIYGTVPGGYSLSELEVFGKK